ncbi:MAG: type II toxin-antitoxin system VapC family toxin [Alphaproteobacteria bacterium]|nr:type II toxin-antitoxin system VapC family toxin [Alphaproteobacteria bacterium]
MIVLDTNVLSELMRPAPDAAVERWIAAQASGAIFISAVTEAELRYGIALLPDGRRRLALTAAFEALMREDFRGRILPFDSAAAVAYAEIAASRRRAGRPIAQADAQIAATAKSRGAGLATRNSADFVDCGIDVVDPWKGA